MITKPSEHEGKRIEARRRNAKALRLRYSKSLANRRHRLNKAGKCRLDNPASWENLEALCQIGAFDDCDFEMRKRFGQSLLKDQPLVAAISKDLRRKRVHAKQGRENEHPSIAVFNIRWMHDRKQRRMKCTNWKSKFSRRQVFCLVLYYTGVSAVPMASALPSAPPPCVFSHAAPHALARSRTRKIVLCRSVTEITPRASRRLKICEALMH